MPRRLVVALIAALAAGAVWAQSAAPQGPAEVVQVWRWQGSGAAFGGFSGIELDAAGRGLVVLSDRGTIWRGQIARDAAEAITGIEITAGPTALHTSTGAPAEGETGDSEGLALDADGVAVISFEGVARVSRFPSDGGPAKLLPRPQEFARMQLNSALEALAIAEDGTLYTLPERSGDKARAFPVFRLKPGAAQWDQPFAIPRDGDWLPVGADFGPDGRLYLLERDFWGLLGFLSRVRVFDVAGETISGGAVVMQSRAGRFDNLEGIAAWRDASGAIRLTLVSDDNFNPLQQTQLVELRLSR